MEASFVTHLRSSPPRASFPEFERFFREEYPAVVRIAFGVVGDAQAAQDVAQDVFISADTRTGFPLGARQRTLADAVARVGNDAVLPGAKDAGCRVGGASGAVGNAGLQVRRRVVMRPAVG
jgi:Sigma-70 region 2